MRSSSPASTTTAGRSPSSPPIRRRSTPSSARRWWARRDGWRSTTRAGTGSPSRAARRERSCIVCRKRRARVIAGEGSVALHFTSHWRRETIGDDASPASLTSSEREILTRLAEGLFPAGGAIPVDGVAAGVPETFARYLAGFSPPIRRRVRLLLRGFDFLPFATGHRRRFRALAPAARAAFLDHAATGPLW